MSPQINKRLNDFFSKYNKQDFKKGQIIIHGNKNPGGIFFIVSGQIRQYDINKNGDEIVLNIFTPPAFIPMSWAIGNIDNEFFYQAFTPVTLHKAPAKDVLDFLNQNPEIAFDLLARVYRGIATTHKRMLFIMQNSALRRIIFEILHSYDHFAQNNNGKIVIPISEQELASRIGLTRETVNRELRKLKKSGALQISLSGITVCDINMLKKELYPQ